MPFHFISQIAVKSRQGNIIEQETKKNSDISLDDFFVVFFSGRVLILFTLNFNISRFDFRSF